MRVLLVEDDRKTVGLLQRGLREEGFAVDTASDGAAGDELASANDYDVIVLDWLLPRKTGIELCRDLRARGVRAPILMLTAKDTVRDRVAGLDAGADDYLVKPFAFEELVARVRALLRRGSMPRAPVLEVEDLRLDPSAHRVTRAGRLLDLTPKEEAILEVLMRHAGDVVTRAWLAERVWEAEVDDLSNLLDVHVGNLRRKVDGAGSPPLVHTVRGRGFRLGRGTDRT